MIYKFVIDLHRHSDTEEGSSEAVDRGKHPQPPKALWRFSTPVGVRVGAATKRVQPCRCLGNSVSPSTVEAVALELGVKGLAVDFQQA